MLPEIIHQIPIAKIRENEWALEQALAFNGVVRIPTHIYQKMADNTVHETEVAKLYIKGILNQYMEKEFPSYHLVSFVDFSTKEAEAIHPLLQWGMYIKVMPKYEVPALEDSLKAITNG